MIRAAMRLIAYDADFRFPFGHSNLIALDRTLNISILIGDKPIEEYFSNTRGGKSAYLDMLNKNILDTYMNCTDTPQMQLGQKLVSMICHYEKKPRYTDT